MPDFYCLKSSGEWKPTNLKFGVSPYYLPTLFSVLFIFLRNYHWLAGKEQEIMDITVGNLCVNMLYYSRIYSKIIRCWYVQSNRTTRFIVYWIELGSIYTFYIICLWYLSIQDTNNSSEDFVLELCIGIESVFVIRSS